MGSTHLPMFTETDLGTRIDTPRTPTAVAALPAQTTHGCLATFEPQLCRYASRQGEL